MRTDIIFGPPGTGKTTALLGEVEAALAAGTDPARIAYFAFTRKAATEAAERATQRFDFTEEDFVWFRTLHSAAFHILGLSTESVMQQHHYNEMAQALGYTFAHSYDESIERVPVEGALGDRCLYHYSMARATMVPLAEAWRRFRMVDTPWVHVDRFAKTLDAYKKSNMLMDFTDFLDEVQDPLHLELLIVDEAQDLTKQQWAFVRRIGAYAKRVIIAGDDDQAIFEWAGADIRTFLALRGNVKILPVSYRLPKTIWSFANTIAQGIRTRRPKEWKDNGSAGAIQHLDEPEQANLKQGEWLMLCRNKYQLAQLARTCRDQGVVYKRNGKWSNQTRAVRAVVAYEALRAGKAVPTRRANMVTKYIPGLDAVLGTGGEATWAMFAWPFEGRPDWMSALSALGDEDREYIRKLRREGESLAHPGRVALSTIHSIKGGEAENVLLLTDVSKRVFEESTRKPDAEARVWYVGTSRAKQTLHIVRPHGQRFFLG